MRLRIALLAGLLALVPAHASLVDPLTVAHRDFARVADTTLWAGLTVERREARDGAVAWRLWRIASTDRPDGPLWVIPHDDENAAFAAGLRAVKRWGGVLIAVDSGHDDTQQSARYVRASDGRRHDPNRTFTAAYPAYVAAVMAGAGDGRPIVALHTNAAGFDPALATCGDAAGVTGGGGVSIRLCNATYRPRPAPTRGWPWDDDDSVVIAPYLAGGQPGDGWCQDRLTRGNFSISFERVAASDGSLSNYAAQRGLPYLNFETRDRGSHPAGLAEAERRLTAMIDAAMARCLAPDTRLLAAAGSGKEVR